MKKLCEEYKKKYGRELEDDVKGDTSGYVRRLYIVLLQVRIKTITNTIINIIYIMIFIT